MENLYINHLAVLICALSSLVIGGIWYSPALFFHTWQRESGLTEDKIKDANMFKVYGLTFILALIMSYNLAFYLGDSSTTWQWGLAAGFLAGFGWATLMFAVIALFERKSFLYVLVNGGYITLWFTIIGFILGIWR